ncbi:VOC family protein [Halalkalibacter sp. APA_J-10(15)]|uniref:VOC family protein n=1 Tax=Halalkalibacter sp. APA_J-10(15) TaxID=2933805 RepID=UPI002795B2B6|nr:VOC family protein [Halalkalibacter sp. APA_J-10(15)]
MKKLIRIKQLHHVSLVCRDLQRSVVFYRDMIGLEQIERPDFDFEGAWFALGAGQLHLIVDEARIPNNPLEPHSRNPHFAIRVEDYNETVKWLKENEIEMIEKPHSKSGFAQIFCQDPDGYLIELHVPQEELRKSL